VAAVITQDYAVFSVLKRHSVSSIYVRFPNTLISLDAMRMQARMMGILTKKDDTLINGVLQVSRLSSPGLLEPGKYLQSDRGH
jgi:hypothetical protein